MSLEETISQIADQIKADKFVRGQLEASIKDIDVLRLAAEGKASRCEFEIVELQGAARKNKETIARLESKVAELDKVLEYAVQALGASTEDNIPAMLRAIEAGIVSRLHPTKNRERHAYLRRRGWQLDAVGWKNIAKGQSWPYEISVVKQIEEDQKPWVGLIPDSLAAA